MIIDALSFSISHRSFNLSLFSMIVTTSLWSLTLASSDTVDLKLALPKGFSAKVTIHSEFESTSDDTHPNKPVKTEKTRDNREDVYLVECIETNKDGNMTIRQTLLSSTLTVSDPIRDWNRSIDFSDKENLSEPFTTYLLNSPMTYLVKSDGSILSVQGYQTIADALAPIAAEHLYLGREEVEKELRRRPIVGIAEFCAKGPIRIGETHTEEEIPKTEQIPPVTNYSKIWKLVGRTENTVQYEVTYDSSGEQDRTVRDFAGTHQTITKEQQTLKQHLTCDISTGFILKSVLNARIDNEYNFVNTDTIRKQITTGTTTIESVVSSKQRTNTPESRNDFRVTVGIAVLTGIIIALLLKIAKARKGGCKSANP